MCVCVCVFVCVSVYVCMYVCRHASNTQIVMHFFEVVSFDTMFNDIGFENTRSKTYALNVSVYMNMRV